MGPFILFKRLWALLSGSGLLIKILKNWSVLSACAKTVEDVLHNMTADGRTLPTQEETQVLLLAASNFLKTGIVNVPGVDEYEIALSLDQMSSSLALSVKDLKSGKFHTLPPITIKGKK